jgi:hypothetical protein
VNTDPKPVILRVTAVYEYELEPDLEKRQASYGTTDPAECAKIDTDTDDLMILISDADLKSFTIEPVTAKPANDEVMSVECPHCHAHPEKWCKDFMGGKALTLHAKRIRAAITAREA